MRHLEGKTAKEILDDLHACGVKMMLDGEMVRFWPPPQLSEADWESMRNLKREIIELLKGGEYPFAVTEKTDLGVWEVMSDSATRRFKAGSLYSNDPFAKGEGRWMASLDDRADSIAGVNLHHVDRLTDEEIVVLVRKSAEVAKMEAAIWRAKQIVEDFIGYFGELWTIDEFQSIYERDYELLYRLQDEPEIKELLERFEPYWRGDIPSAGYIYCLSDQQGHYKIGRTRQLQQRIKNLGTQPPFKIQLLFTHYVFNAALYERHLHQMFAKKRMNGEWFALDEKDLEVVKKGDWANIYR